MLMIMKVKLKIFVERQGNSLKLRWIAPMILIK